MLKKELDWKDGIGIGIGAMIGGGVFTVSALAVKVAGGGAVLAFSFSALVAAIIGYIYSRLSIKIRSSGGSYSFIVRFFPSKPFYLTYGYLLIFSYAVAIGFYANTFASYAYELVKLSKFALAIFPIALFTLANLKGAKESARLQNLIVLAKVLVLLLFIYVGLRNPKIPEINLSSSVFLASSFTFIMFEGFELIANSAEEMKRPERDLPLAIIGSVAAVSIIYILVVLSLISLGGDFEAGEAPLARAAARVIGNIAYPVFFTGALFATFSAINSTLFGLSRLVYAMAREGELHSSLAKLNGGIPQRAVLFSAFLSALALLLPIDKAAAIGSSVFLLAFMLVCASSLALNAVNPALAYIAIFLVTIPVIFGEKLPVIVTLFIFLSVTLLLYSREVRSARA